MFDRRQGIVNQWQWFKLTGPRALARLLAATVFPPTCCLCGFPGASLDLDLCAVCQADLPWAPQLPGMLAALNYQPPVDELIRRLKYQGVIANARVLGVLLAQVAQRHRTDLPKLLVPVPLHDARWRERGFNQAAAIARYTGQLLGIPVARHAVKRTRDTPSQTALDVAQRRHNVHGAFAVGNPRQARRLCAAGHVAVVDDVITTGSTASEVRDVLCAAGVRTVEVWAAARAERSVGAPWPG